MDNFPKKEKNLSNPNFVHPLTLRIYPMSYNFNMEWFRGLYIEIDIEYFRYRSQGESVTRQQ